MYPEQYVLIESLVLSEESKHINHYNKRETNY